MYFCHKHLINNGSIRLCYKSHKYFKLKYVKRLLKFMGALLYILICQMFPGNNSVQMLIDDCNFKYYDFKSIIIWHELVAENFVFSTSKVYTGCSATNAAL